MKKTQSMFVAAVIAAFSSGANCDITRFEFDALVTFVSNQRDLPKTIKAGDVFSGHVDMDPDLAPPVSIVYNLDFYKLGSYSKTPATPDWIEAEVSLGGVKLSSVDFLRKVASVIIADSNHSGQPSEYDIDFNYTNDLSGIEGYFSLSVNINDNQAPSLSSDFITGLSLEQNFTWSRESDNFNPPAGFFSYAEETTFDGPNVSGVSVSVEFSLLGVKSGPVTPTTPANLSGTIKTADGFDVCAMVLASGEYTFSCNPAGVFSLTDLPRENDGTVKRQIYADGFFPEVDTLTESSVDAVVMTRSGTCPSYNTPYDPGVFPDSAGKRIDISGKVLQQNTQTPICAMALANGQYTFSCDGTGSYALNIPLDNNGQFKLQVYADGFAPKTQTFDEFQAINDVRLARAAECQTAPPAPPPPPLDSTN